MLTLEELGIEVEAGTIDTVVCAFTDMQGRLMGKREQAQFFLEETAGHGLEGCNYLLALDMEMDPQPGYAMASWERGYGDFALKPDLGTLRRVPWLEGTALVLCDVAWEDGSPVVASPRQVLAAQVRRRAAAGFEPMIGSELEFYLLKESYAEAWAKHYRDLTPSVPYILDYHVLATTYDEGADPPDPQRDAGRRDRGRELEGRGVARSAGDQLPLRRRDANGRQPRDLQERRQGDRPRERLLDHVHGEARSHLDRQLLPCPREPLARRRRTPSRATATCSEQFLAGWIACAKELALFLAPNINSYKRYAAGSWAPTTLAWGRDNRTCGFRIVGHGSSQRVETRIPGGDVNPYLAFAALIAAGLHGIEQGLELPPALEGNAYESDAERFPPRCATRSRRSRPGRWRGRRFGDEVVDHYLNYGRTEQRLFDEVVTCWERERLFERG